MKKRIISFFTALSMTFMLFDLPFDFGTVPVSAADPAPHVHDMSVSCGGSEIEFQPYPGGPIEPGSYYLTGNVSHVAIWRIKTPGVYNLCLNGYSINPARIEIEENVTFNLCDCKGTGSIISFSDPGIYGLHGVDGEFNMYGGKLIGSGRADRQERGVSIVGNGKFTMYAGEITGYNGEDMGGVAVSGNGTFIMNGGKITNNTVQSEFAGAGVRSYGADSTIIINGGEISGNHGFGVEAWGRFEINGGKIINNDKGGVMVTKMPYISGSPVIKDNYHDGKPFNLSLGNNKLHLLGPLGSDFEMGIASCDSSYIFTDNWNETMGDADPADYFTSDSDITKVKRYSDEGALCVLLTLDTSGWTGIVGDIPDPAYYPRFMEVELPKDLKLKGYIFGGWSETPNRPQGSSSIELKGDTTVYPAFKSCTHGSKGLVFQVDPTCTKTGLEKYVLCDYCGMTFESFSNLEPFEPGILPVLGHDFGDWTTVEEATCTADGIKERVCKRNKCGQKETDIIPQTGHDFGTDYEKNETQHWQICTKCNEESEKSNHTWDDGEVTKSPSETEEGETTYNCTVCGVTKTEHIAKLEHTHNFVPHVAVPATCTTDGNEAYWTCLGCNKMFSDENGITEITAIPTIPATGHKFSTDWTSDDTYHWHAATCGHDVVSEMAVHTEDGGTVTVPATTENDGLKTYACSVCGYVMRTVTIPKLGEDHAHNFSPDWKHDSTSHWHECDCGEKNEIAPHIENSGVVTTAPTETSTGIMTYSCETCGYVMRTDVIPALIPEHNHTFGTDWKYDSVSHWHECECGEKSDIANHISSDWIVVTPATIDLEGVQIRKCTVCDIEIDRETIEKLPNISAGEVVEDVRDTAGTNARLVQDNTLIENVLTSEDKAEVIEGHRFEIVLEVTDIRDSVPASDVAAASSALRYNEQIGIYVDLSLFKIKDNSERTPIYNTSGRIGITLTVPDSIYASDRTYSIIRVHDGIAENLGGTYNRTNRELTFYTDKFSTYAIAYAASNSGTDRPTVPDTPTYPSVPTYPNTPVVPVTPTVTETTVKKEEEVISDEPYVEDVSSAAGIYESGEADNNIHYVMILIFAAAAGIAAIAAKKYFCKKNMK